jgi:dipeptidyl aminopeptidase/acylaminoacyl peptidase
MVRDCSVKYPVLFYVYGGPYSQMIGDVAVTNRLSIAYFSSHLNMVIVSVDGRGTGFRGNKFKFSVYHQLGRLETEDQLKAAR